MKRKIITLFFVVTVLLSTLNALASFLAPLSDSVTQRPVLIASMEGSSTTQGSSGGSGATTNGNSWGG